MEKYHKIQTIYLRDPSTKYKTLLEGQYAEPEFEYLAHNEWVFTEKVDGTNVRVMWDGSAVRFGGKTDDAQMPVFLTEKLLGVFPADRFASVFDGPATLYGEGYGARIQKGGGNYIPNGVSFILFDVRCGDVWLERENVEDIASKLSIDVVPVIRKGPLAQAIEMARCGFLSAVAQKAGTMAEGLVMRPSVELQNRMGHRIITKIKHKDFPGSCS